MDEVQTRELIEAVNKLTIEMEKTTKNLIKDTTPVNHDIVYFIKRYIQEVMEAAFGLFAVSLITKKEFVLYDFIKIVLIIGFVTLILEEYNLTAADNFKQGIHFTIGAVALGG
jgi:hypothetical protein